MKRFLVTCAVIMIMCVFSCGQMAFAQWDNRGCSQYGVSASSPETIESSLWTFRSDAWDGYIDFMEGGKYLTHWGWGKWSVTEDGKGVHMANEYNDRTYEIAFTDNGYRFQGIGNNGLIITGMLICAKYQGPGPRVPDEVAEKIKGLYKNLLSRDADPKELREQFVRFNKGATIEDITNLMTQTLEYRQKAAAAAQRIRELEESGQLGW